MTYEIGMKLTTPAGDLEIVALNHSHSMSDAAVHGESKLVSIKLQNENGDVQEIPAKIITDGIESGKITVKA